MSLRISNVLAVCLRRGDFGLHEAHALQREAEALMSGREHEVSSRHVLQLVHDTTCTAHDCEFAALAQRLGVKLVTMDKGLLRAFPSIAVPRPAR